MKTFAGQKVRDHDFSSTVKFVLIIIKCSNRTTVIIYYLNNGRVISDIRSKYTGTIEKNDGILDGAVVGCTCRNCV